MFIPFGAGNLYAIQNKDAFGNINAVPTPIKVAALQEFTLESSGDLKLFHGQNQLPLDAAVGKTKLNGKFKGALFNASAMNNLYFGRGVTTGTMSAISIDTAGTVLTVATLVVTPPNSGTLTDDLGVEVNGVAYMRVTGTPTTGQYAFDIPSKTYTFAAADIGKKVNTSFKYTYASASSKRLDLTNLTMGSAPSLRLIYENVYKGRRCLVDLSSVLVPKMHLIGAKNDDYNIPELDFEAMADDTGYSAGSIYITE